MITVGASWRAILVCVALAGCAETRLVDDDAAQTGLQRGLAAIKRSDWSTAEQYLLIAAAKYPDDPYLWLDLGVVWQNMGQYDKARRAYEKVIERDLDDVPEGVTDPALADRSLTDIAKINMARLPK